MQDTVTVAEWASYVNIVLGDIRGAQTRHEDLFDLLIVLSVVLIILAVANYLKMRNVILMVEEVVRTNQQ